MRTGLRARPALLLGGLAVRAIEYDTEAVALLASRLRQPDSLDGLNVALAAYAPGPMTQVKWKVALYLDERADPAQRDALAKIFSGQAGGPPGGLTALIGEVLGVKSAGIEFRVDGKRRGLRIAGVAEADIEALTGQEGKEVTVSNHPLTAVPGFPAVVARSKRASYHDHGLAPEVMGKNGFYSPFEYRP